MEEQAMFDRLYSRRQVLKGGAVAAGGLILAPSALASRVSWSGTAYTPPSATATGTLTISNWGDPNDQKVYAAVRKRFNEKFPHVKIHDNFTPITTWTDYINKLIAQVAAGKAPDIINIATEGFRLGVAKHMFMPLDGFITKDPAGAKLFADVDKALVNGFKSGGKTYLVPYNWNNMLIHYNTKMFAAAGIARPSADWTWDDFLAIAKKLTTNDVYGFALPFFTFGLTPWWYSNGTALLSSDLSKPNLTDPKLVEAVTFVRDLVTTHKVAPSVSGADPYQLFPAGKVAMTGAGHWVVGSFRSQGFSDYDVLPWPKQRKKATVFGAAGFGIYPGSKQKDLAWEYVKMLAGPQTSKGFVAIGSANPARRSIAETKAFLSTPAHANLFYGSLAYARPVQAPIKYPDVDTIVMRHLGEVMSGSKTPQDAMQAANSELAAAFKS